MKLADVLRWRIARQLLGADRGARRGDGGPPGERPARAGGVVGAGGGDLRLAQAPDLERALYQDRSLVRTWAARGTLHLLPAADLPLWVAAMSTRTRETTGSWLKFHGVTAAQMRDIIAAVPDVLGATPMTRDELADGDHRRHRPRGSARAADPGFRCAS